MSTVRVTHPEQQISATMQGLVEWLDKRLTMQDKLLAEIYNQVAAAQHQGEEDSP